jgi:hypothetical protein
MTWFTTEPDPVVVSEDRYFERRPNPTPGKDDQFRKRKTIIREYRGISLYSIFDLLEDYPQITTDSLITRNASPVGDSGGWTIVETEDAPENDWQDVQY